MRMTLGLRATLLLVAMLFGISVPCGAQPLPNSTPPDPSAAPEAPPSTDQPVAQAPVPTAPEPVATPAPAPPLPPVEPPAAQPLPPQPVAPSPSPVKVERPWRITDARFIVSADRVVGFHSWSYEFEQDGPSALKSEHSGTMLNFLGGNATAASGSWRPVNASALPRVGFDVLFGTATLGGAFSYITTSGESETRATGSPTTTNDDPDGSLLLFGARGGILVPWFTTATFWPRAGLYRVSYTEDGTFGEFSTTETVVSLEPVVVLTPVPRVGITFGPVVDFAVTGKAELDQSQADLNGDGLPDGVPTTKGDLSVTNFGIAAGIAGVF